MQVNLNDVQAILANDPGKMLEAIWRLPEQCETALDIASKAALPEDDFSGLTEIVVTGLGGLSHRRRPAAGFRGGQGADSRAG